MWRLDQSQLQAILDNCPASIVVKDLDGRFLLINRECERILGITREEIRAKTDFDLFAPDVARTFRRNDRQVAQSATPIEYEESAPLADGVHTYQSMKFPLRDKSGVVYATCAVALDITDRQRARRQLVESEERFRGLIEHSWDAIALLDREGNVTYASPSTTRMLGYPIEEFVGRNAYDLIHADHHAAVRERVASLLRSPGVPVTIQAPVRHRDGTWRVLEAVLTNLLHVPTIGAIVNNYRDVTDRAQLEAQLLQVQKVDAIGRLAGGIAHDFNNMLTAIMGHTALARMSASAGQPVDGELDAIDAAASRSAALTRQLLAFARKQLMQPVPLDVNELVTRLEGLLRRLIGEHVTLTVRLARGPCAVMADPGQIEQVVVNLAVNARDAMSEGGTLIIETATATLDAVYAQSHAEVVPGDYVVLALSDTGVGMSEAVRAHLFEPFFTTKPQGEGTGLGLATSYGIVRQHRGYLWVYSEEGRGTTVKIHLPAAQAAPRPVAASTGAAGEPARGTETILLAEDEDAVRAVTRDTLTRCGYVVIEASNGDEALLLASRYSGPIHLLVTDVVMPRMNGRELTDRLRAERPALAVLFMSGYTENTVSHRGVLDAGVGFLGKPFTPTELAARVRQALDG